MINCVGLTSKCSTTRHALFFIRYLLLEPIYFLFVVPDIDLVIVLYIFYLVCIFNRYNMLVHGLSHQFSRKTALLWKRCVIIIRPDSLC